MLYLYIGPVYLVFEGASHTRFGHSIGVAYLANKLITYLKSKQPDLNIKSSHIKYVTLAGLLHDIGHGPFSHLTEQILPGLHHETMSCKIMKRIIKKYNLRYSQEDILIIEQLILGICPNNMEPWIAEIVSNAKTSIDVDKFDYFQRDSKYANIQMTYNPTRFFTNVRVIDGHLAYSAKEIFNVYELYHTRYILFKTVYYHRVVESLSLMIKDALQTKLYPQWKELIVKPDNEKEIVNWYLKLTDNLLYTTNIWFNKICCRDLYKLAWEGVFDKEENVKMITKQWILNNIPKLSSQDFDVIKRKINFTHGHQNPLQFVKFYSNKKRGRFQSMQTFTLKGKKQTPIISMNRFQEFIVRIYSKRQHGYVKNKILTLMEQHKINTQIANIQYK